MTAHNPDVDTLSGDPPVKRALVVEGGAMRGIFAAGVLDSFLDNDFRRFDFCIGVSAGSTNLAGYLAGQRGRSHRLITDYSCRADFINLKKYLTGGHYIDLDWLWKIAYREYRLDAQAFASQDIPLWVTSTDVTRGCARYTRPTEETLEGVLLASCAVPLAYRGYPMIADQPQTDGGVADAIPVLRAYELGARDITVIRSQQGDYRKKPPAFPGVIRQLFRTTPALGEAMLRRHQSYNDAVAFTVNPPADCMVTIIAPPAGFAVSRTTTNRLTLNAGYEMGLHCGQDYINGLSVFRASQQSIMATAET